MPTQDQPAAPTPQLFFQTANAYQRSQALKAAVELDLFTAIGGGHDTVDTLAQRCGAAARGVRILADYLTIQGFMLKEGNRYKLTPDSTLFLDRRSPAYMGSVLGFLHAPKFIESFQHLTDAVRKGGTVAGEAGTVAPEHPLWVEFAKSMIPMMAKPAEEIALFVRQTQPEAKKVLDIAAGHGLFGIEIAKTASGSRDRGARLAERAGSRTGVGARGGRAVPLPNHRGRCFSAGPRDRL